MWNGRNRMSSPVTMPPTWKLLSIMDRPMELASCKMCSVIMYDTLWLFNIAMENGPFIDGLPINSMVISHGELLNNQMIMWMSSWSFHPCNPPYRIVPMTVPGKRNWMELGWVSTFVGVLLILARRQSSFISSWHWHTSAIFAVLDIHRISLDVIHYIGIMISIMICSCFR